MLKGTTDQYDIETEILDKKIGRKKKAGAFK